MDGDGHKVSGAGGAETRSCQNCQAGFTIEPEDFDFYKRMAVPPPTFCPECRMVRRMTWRNERAFHKGKCAATGKEFLTMFHPDSGVTVYDRDHWWSDKWDQLESGREYDFSRPFFEQFAELMRRAPLPNLANSNCPGVEYGNHNADCKNCYLLHASYNTEDSAYVTGAVGLKDSFDLYKALNGSQCYENTLCGDCSRTFFSYDSDEIIQSEFMFACKNMQQSFACANMRNQSYCIFNKPHAKEEYAKERSRYDLGSYKALQDLKEEVQEFVLGYPRRYATILKSTNVTGDGIMNSKNCRNCFDAFGELEDCKYMCHAMFMKDGYDGYGAGKAELMYEVVDTGLQAMRCMFNVFTHSCHDVSYTYACHSSSYLFGCVGLRSKQYCILNKQYTKEEYEELVPKIIEQMQAVPFKDSKGRGYGYGEFFPIELSPFAYNETIAQEYFPLTAGGAEAKGYPWRKDPARTYAATITAADLPDHIKDAPDSVLQDVIECAHKGECNEQCTTAFRIIPSELQFHRQFGLALPRLCPNCRHYERLATRNPFKLWKRSCLCAGEGSENGKYKNTTSHFHGAEPCPTEVETPYAPERPDMIYCEQCYQAEVI